MREDYRLFSCARCHCQVAICSVCDRGQWYCGKACSQQTRRELSRAASQRYQATRKGRRHHAARQARLRKKQRATQSTKEVTHRGTPTPEAQIRLRSTIAESPPTVRCQEAGEVGEEAGAGWVLCDFCGARCQPFARREPLRCRRRRRTTDPRGSRAGQVPRAGSGRPVREPARRPR
jgi:hypothetical protein